ncbi:DnaD domain protein [uncultured Finegoldia sp.]|uniref:DnaD domain-containing protein n=1 Tax=uncultured Finegoldia sp. TaxID=328009 RepID=UPI00261057CB|nr:DnaD domain protein [uncultured Finegoldia sp.]
MKYSVEKFKIDLGETPIENLFLNQYLQIATGNQLKVYLYAFKLANDTSANEDISDDVIAKALDLTENEVSEAWNYWLDQGIIKRYTDVKTQTDHTVFLSLRQLYLGITNPEPEESQKTYIPENSNEIKEMFRDIEDIRDMEMSKSEMERVLEHIATYHQTPELVVCAFHYCTTNPNTKNNTNYVLQVLRNWKLDGIMTMEQWQEENNKKKQRKTKKRTYYRPQNNDIDNATHLNSKVVDAFMKKAREQKDKK